MIKGIIEKIIMNTFGKFVKGIEKQKLSVDLFSGNFRLQNIALNHDFFNSLDSPLSLVFSSIGTLTLQASLSKLSSVPVECVLDNIFVICQFREAQAVGDSTAARQARLLREVGEAFESALRKVKQEKKEDGMMARLGKKVIDNLQLRIMNVHVRFQEGSSRTPATSYAWGLTLQEISLTTTDAVWKPTFIERNNDAADKLYKMLQVRKLNFYWESGTAGKLQMLREKEHSDTYRKTRLSQMVKEDRDVVLSITSEFKLIINPEQETTLPLYELQVGLEPIKFQLQRLQLQQIMDFARKHIMQNELIVKSIGKRAKSKLSEQQKGRLKEHFEEFIAQALEAQANGGTAKWGQSEVLQQVFQRIEESQLKLWALGPVKKKVKNIREVELKKKKGGWFNRGDNQLTQQEQQQLQRYIDTSVEGEASKRDPSCLLFRVNMELRGGKMLLVQHKGQQGEQQIEFSIGRICCLLSKSSDKSYFHSQLDIASISLDLFLPILKNGITRRRKLQIFTSERPDDYKEDSDNDSMQSFDSAEEEQRPSFLKMQYKNELLEGAVMKRTVDGHVERLTVIYKKLYMEKFRKFLTFKRAASFVKPTLQAAPDEDAPEELADSGFRIEKILDVRVSINSPVFICPLNEQECWCLSLGRLSVQSKRSEQMQEYPMHVSSAFLRYYPFMKECFDMRKKQLKSGVFSLINDMDFQLTYQRRKQPREELLAIELPSFKVNFTQKQYDNLVSLQKVFAVQDEEKKSMIQILREERQAVEEGKVFQGVILRKHQTLMSWKEFHGILSGEHLFLYNDPKELREHSKITVKHAKITIKESEGQQGDVSDSREIEIANQSETCYLGCHSIDELLKWKVQLDKKNRQFKTIHELIKDHEVQEHSSNKKRSGSECYSHIDEASKRKQLRFRVQQVEFRYESEKGQPLVELQVTQVEFSRESQHEWSEKHFSMRSLSITDQIFKFSNPAYQTLVRAQGVSLQQVKGRRRGQQGRKAAITASIADIHLNWKPDVLLILMRLLNRHFQTEKKHRVDDDIEQSRDDHFQQVNADTNFNFLREAYNEKGKGIKVKQNRDSLSLKSSWMRQTMNTTIAVDKLQINMIHRQTHLVMIKLLADKIDCGLSVCETAKFLRGTLADLELFDMTGYPQKEYSAGVEHAPYRILAKQPHLERALMEFRWSSYDANSFPNEEHVDSFIWVEIAPVEYEYYQQVTFRLVDYVLIQVILLLTQPDMLTVNEDLLQQLQREQQVQQKPVRILFSQYQQLIRRLVHPYFMDMSFRLQDLALTLKAEKTSHIFYKLLVKELHFVNSTRKSAARFEEETRKTLEGLAYEDEYCVTAKDCRFIQVCEKQKRTEELFQPFEMELKLNKLMFQDEINLLFPQIDKYDRSFITENVISRIVIAHYSRLQYLNVNKLVNFNFTFDDQNDELFIHNFKITKLLSPKPIYYQVLLPSIKMTADYNASQNSSDIWQLFRADIDDFRLLYRRSKHLDSSITLSFGSTRMTAFQYLPMKTVPIQYPLLKLSARGSQASSTEIVMENKTSGQKLIQMNVGDMQVSVRTGLLQLIFEYTLIEDWVFPTVNKFVTELVFYATVQKMTAELSQDPRVIAAELERKKASPRVVEWVLSGGPDLANFRLQGLLCYKFHRKRDDTVQQYQGRLRRGELTFDDFEAMPPVASMNVILNTEIHRGWARSSARRKLMEKFTYTMEQRRHLRVADMNAGIIRSIAKRSMNIDRAHLKLSFKDIILMQRILGHIGQQRKYITYLNEKTGKRPQPKQNIRETEGSSLQNLDVKVDTLSFYLINSRSDIFIPILKISVGGLSLTKANTFKKDILKGEFTAAIYYFNNSIFRWEPILEKVALGFHKLTYYQQNNSVFASFDSPEDIMLNLSRQVFVSLNQTMAGWKKQSEEEEKKYLKEGNEVEPLEFISHYIIRNETGYPIDVLNDRGTIVGRLEQCDQMDYQQQIEDWQENESQIFIGIRIIHPRYQLKAINNISFSSNREYELQPKLVGGPNSIINMHSKIVIKPEVRQSKKVLMVKSSKYVYNYFDGACQVTPLPFDHDIYYVLPREIHNQMKVSLYEETASEYYRYVGKDGILKIMKKNLVYNYSPIPLQICGKIARPGEYMGISEKLRIQDVPYKDSLLKVIKQQKLKEFYIFSQCYLIDYYGLAFQFEKESRTIQKMYSHKFNRDDFTYQVYLLPETEFKFKAKLPEGGTNSASLRTTIGRTCFTLETKKSLCMFTLNSYLQPLENEHISEFARIIEITPQYMLSNATKLLVKICQAESCDSITLNPYERVPFFWENKTKLKYIRISAYDGSDFWGYSGNLTIQKSTETLVLRKSSDPTMYRVFSIQVEVTSTVTFIHILESSPKYLIANSVPGTTLQVYQAAIMDEKLDLEMSFPKEFVFNVKFREEKAFGYQLPLQSHRLQVKVELDKSRPELEGLQCQMISFEDVEGNLDSKKIPLRNKQGSIVGQFHLRLVFENNLKKLKLSTEIEPEEVENTYEFIVKLPRVGISFIGFYDKVRREILHLILDGIETTFSGNADYSDMNLIISRCRIENELKYNAIFPVVFESQHTKQAKYFINFKLSRSGRNSRLIHYIGCSINKSWLTITSEELQAIQENISQISAGAKAKWGGEVRECQMFRATLPDPEESIYFVEAVIHPLKSNITFKHVNEWGGKLLKTFSSINQCPISAEGLKFKHFGCQNFGLFFDLLIKHYQDGLSKMILPMIGNLTILGSPVTFVQKIGSGFKDLVELPAEGFETSPLEGGKGMYRGAKSLLTNTFQGAFNTVESLTGSLGNGITLLVDDHQEFTKERLSIKNDRSQHVLGGLANGAKSIAYGVKNGFTGFFTEPVKGAEKSGLPGFFLGAAKGIGGLILKPLSGVVDAASKTAEGIKNTPEFLARDRENRYVRQHNPRPFYNYYKQYRNYDKFFADILKIFQQENKDKFSNLSWCGYYTLISEKKSSTPILFLSYELLIIFDISKNRFLQVQRCETLLGVELNEENERPLLRIKIWEKKSNREGFITVCPDGGCRKLASEINTIIRHFSPNFKFV